MNKALTDQQKANLDSLTARLKELNSEIKQVKDENTEVKLRVERVSVIRAISELTGDLPQ